MSIKDETIKIAMVGISGTGKSSFISSLNQKFIISSTNGITILPRKEEQNEKIKTIQKVGKSLLIVIPIILIIVLLLSSADSVFGSLFTSISEFISKAFESEKVMNL